MKRSKNKQKNMKQVWMVGTALALAAVAIFLVTFYSGSLSLTAYRDSRPINPRAKIATKLECSVSGGTVQAVLSAPGKTLGASQLSHLRIMWSTAKETGYVSPLDSLTNNTGVAQTSYFSRGNGGSNTVQARFLGGWPRSGFEWLTFRNAYYYEPSTCTVAVSGTSVGSPTPTFTPIKDPTPQPSITPIKDPTPQPTICPRVCRFVNGKLHCGC